jgi:hypothetical protein
LCSSDGSGRGGSEGARGIVGRRGASRSTFGTRRTAGSTASRSRERRGSLSTACGLFHRSSASAIRRCGSPFERRGPLAGSVTWPLRRELTALRVLLICVWGERSINRRALMAIVAIVMTDRHRARRELARADRRSRCARRGLRRAQRGSARPDGRVTTRRSTTSRRRSPFVRPAMGDHAAWEGNRRVQVGDHHAVNEV